jgi:hypothetical protein
LLPRRAGCLERHACNVASDQQDAVTLLALEMHGYTVYVGPIFFA